MMKTLILLAALLANLSHAQDESWHRQLIYGFDFNGVAPAEPGGLTVTNKADTEYASGTTFTTINGSNFNYANDVFGPTGGADNLYSHGVQGATFSIASDAGIEGISDSRGFAISTMGIVSSSATNWKNLMSFTYAGVTFRMEFTASGDVALYNDGGLTSIELNIDGNRAEWHSYGISVSGDSLTFVAINNLNEVVHSQTQNYGFGEDDLLTEVRGGGSNGVASGYAMDDFSLYNGSLNQEQLQLIAANSFAGNGLTQIIPEPSTASLGLLALTGLLARRRRRNA